MNHKALARHDSIANVYCGGILQPMIYTPIVCNVHKYLLHLISDEQTYFYGAQHWESQLCNNAYYRQICITQYICNLAPRYAHANIDDKCNCCPQVSAFMLEKNSNYSLHCIHFKNNWMKDTVAKYIYDLNKFLLCMVDLVVSSLSETRMNKLGHFLMWLAAPAAGWLHGEME